MPLYRPDSRDIKAGFSVSDLNGYYDSQNIIAIKEPGLPNLVLSCVLHHSDNHEGGKGLTLSNTRSVDAGKTWSALEPIEDPVSYQSHDGYQLLLGDRINFVLSIFFVVILVLNTYFCMKKGIYLFYGWNKGSQPEASHGVCLPRTDMQADAGFWMRWSDDFGRTFSGGRVLIPIRRTGIDRANPWGGETIGAFCCDKPSIIDGQVFFAFQKTRDGNGESYGSEVFFLRSQDLLHLHQSGQDPAQASWETLPLGDRGLQTGRGLFLGEEPHVLQVYGKRLFCLWRNELGFLDSAYSENYGETWQRSVDETPQPLVYYHNESGIGTREENFQHNEAPICKAYSTTPLGKDIQEEFRKNSSNYIESCEEYKILVSAPQYVIRNPRGAITPFRTQDGFIALLFYNNGHTERLGYVGRLTCWLVLGRPQKNETIAWGQPELILYWDGVQLDSRDEWNEDWAIVDGSGYADFQEVDGKLVLVASNKLTVRYHEIDSELLSGMKYDLLVRTGDDMRASPPIKEYFSKLSRTDLQCFFQWQHGDGGKFRAPVLPDLRSGSGFTFILELDINGLQEENDRIVLVNGLTTASAALDEPHSKDYAQGTPATVDKGFLLTFVPPNKAEVEAGASIEEAGGVLELSISDGFKLHFKMRVGHLNDRYYAMEERQFVRVYFVLDGGPKVCSVVLNETVYNSAPSGWQFFPRGLGEIGGSDVEIAQSHPRCLMSHFSIVHRPLGHWECMHDSRHSRKK